jgi:hypothetical protein
MFEVQKDVFGPHFYYVKNFRSEWRQHRRSQLFISGRLSADPESMHNAQ